MNSNIYRICIVLGNYYEQVRGGAEYQAYLLSNELRKKGYEVHYIYIDNGKSFNKELDMELHPIKRGWLGIFLRNKYAMLYDCIKIIKELKKINPDVVYQRTGTAHTGAVGFYSRSYGKKFIWHIALDRDVVPLRSHFRDFINGNLIAKKVLEKGVQLADVIIAQTKHQRNLLWEYYGIRCDEVIPNYHPLPANRTERKNDKNSIVSWVANIKPSKQPYKFIDLANNLAGKKNIKFIMAGRASNRFGDEVIIKAKASNNIDYVGELTQEQVNELIERSDIFVNTSSNEGFPNTFIQAWMRGVPVVSLMIDPDNVIKKNKLGLISESLDKMVKDCEQLLCNAALRREIGERARQYAEKNHSIKHNVDNIVKLIQAT